MTRPDPETPAMPVYGPDEFGDAFLGGIAGLGAGIAGGAAIGSRLGPLGAGAGAIAGAIAGLPMGVVAGLIVSPTGIGARRENARTARDAEDWRRRHDEAVQRLHERRR